MRIVGVVGGIASGKSEVTRYLQRRGALRLDADQAGHQVLEERAVRAALAERWGPSIFHEDGSVNRRAIGQIVFGSGPDSREERTFLERVTHPRITALIEAQIAEAREQDSYPVAILDAPLLFEAGWDQFCDEILYVEVPYSQRLARVAGRGWTEAEFRQREAAQLSLENKRQRCHTIIDNSGSLEETFVQLDAVWSSWVRSGNTDAP